MSNNNIFNNTTNLQEVLEILQNKAAGSGSGGVDTSDATATANDILSGKTAYAKGTKITGNIAFQAAKTITPSTTSQIAISAGYYASGSVTVAAIPNTYVKPSYSRGASTYTPGTTNQTISAGTYLTGVQTIKGDSNLVAANIKSGTSIFGVTGTYEGSGGGGSGDAAEWSEAEDAMVMGTLSQYTNDRVTRIGNYAFQYCSSLTSINFPVCMSIGFSAFQRCSNLTDINFPACTSIGNYAFQYCSSLASANFPACTSIGNNTFYGCRNLISANFPACTRIGNSTFWCCSNLTDINFPTCTSIDSYTFYLCSSLASINFPVCTSIGSSAFYGCHRLVNAEFGSNISNTTIKAFIYSSAFSNCFTLTALKLYYPSVVTLSNVNAFTSTPISVSTSSGIWGSIYVPASLVSAYKSATNWATYADRITALPNLITFTIAGIEYQAEEGMTWAQWAASSYNTGSFMIGSTDDVYNAEGVVAAGLAPILAASTTAIIDGKAYKLM